MEDLRTTSNVRKQNRGDLLQWWRGYKNAIMLFSLLFAIVYIIIRPDVIGSLIGNWSSSLITSFVESSDVTTHQWGVILATILVISICIKLFQRRNKS